jgi:Arc/MetJ-type ribon-helix-helix transcriptional regulator
MEKIAVTLDHDLVTSLDQLVREKVFASRSGAIQAAVKDQLNRRKRTRLALECSKLDPKEEQALAELGLDADGREWPQY